MLTEKPNQTLSQKALQRKSTKPIMEKRRRARINSSLAELKNLILDALKKDSARHSKLEKADILEMTVKYLQNLQRQQQIPSNVTDPNNVAKFRAGFNECANQINQFFGQYSDPNSPDSPIRHRLLSHLSNCLTSLQQIPTLSPVNMDVSSTLSPYQSKNMKGVPLLPTRLPSGEIAFFLQQSSLNSPNEQLSQLPCASSPSPYLPLSHQQISQGPKNVLGSAGILSPASSDRSCSSPQSIATPISLSYTNMYEPISLVSSKCQYNDSIAVKNESLIDSSVWRPW